MIVQNTSLLLVTLLLCFSTAQAQIRLGGISDGGGQAVICRDEAGELISVESLDLFEARYFYDWNPTEFSSELDYLKIAQQIAAKIDMGGGGANPTYTKGTLKKGKLVSREFFIAQDIPTLKNRLHDNVERMDNSMKKLPPGIRLTPLGDSNPPLQSEFCQIEQLALYRDSTNTLIVVGDYWEVMDPINKAALLIHEIIYQDFRVHGDKNSDRSRKLVGYAFSERSFENILSGIPKDFVRCWSDDHKMSYRMAVFPLKGGEWYRMQFLRMENEVPMTKSYIDIEKKESPFAEVRPGISIGLDRQSYAPTYENPYFAISLQPSPEDRVKYGLEPFSGLISNDLKYNILCSEYPERNISK